MLESKNNIIGWALLAITAIFSLWLSGLVEIGGKHPVESAAVAILIGLLLINLNLVPRHCEPGIKSFQTPLILGIVLMGASLDFTSLLTQGSEILTIVLTTMFVGFIVILSAAKLFKLSTKLSVLLAAGTTICGGTAIAVIAPLIKAKDEETSYAIGTIALWGILAILVYPEIAKYIAVSDQSFGIFAGTAIHSTPQVVGAGYIFSEEAGSLATAVKLIRNCFLAPVAFLIAIYFSKQEKSSSKKAIFSAFPWFLFGFFIMAWLRTQGIFSAELIKFFSESGKFLILMGMVGVGLNTKLKDFKTVGYSPLVVGLIGSVAVAGLSIFLIQFII